ncbi:hypothetical protein ColLi_00495 [Colletotrichum liriopes]|uniref:Uncharacterized protein n=1 Tax=Colletotrichum liriopes TaxID=708192 RepID=A0AA37GBS7_9PEZI|nr:hypothetical protein ColLi_00495 [Colletotrichum liriopes]
MVWSTIALALMIVAAAEGHTAAWADGIGPTAASIHPEDWRAPAPGKCLVDNPGKKGGEVHTQNYTTTTGTAFAISHQSDIRKAAMENPVVFPAVEQRAGPSDVEVDFLTCLLALRAAATAPGSGSRMDNFRCEVANAVSTRTLGVAKDPNIGYGPGYNARMGFKPGAQTDTFV